MINTSDTDETIAARGLKGKMTMTAQELADKFWSQYLDGRENVKTVSQANQLWSDYQQNLDNADIIPTLAGYRFRKDTNRTPI